MPELTAEQVALIDDAFSSLIDAVDPASLEQMDQGLKDKLIGVQQLIEGLTQEAQGPQYQDAATGGQ